MILIHKNNIFADLNLAINGFEVLIEPSNLFEHKNIIIPCHPFYLEALEADKLKGQSSLFKATVVLYYLEIDDKEFISLIFGHDNKYYQMKLPKNSTFVFNNFTFSINHIVNNNKFDNTIDLLNYIFKTNTIVSKQNTNYLVSISDLVSLREASIHPYVYDDIEIYSYQLEQLSCIN